MLDLQNDFPPLWTVYSPTKVVFGPGSLDELGTVCLTYGKSALLVTGSSALRTGLSERCVKILQQVHIRVGEHHSITSDPTVHQVNELVTAIISGQFKMLVAAGGGSVMDAAKAASVIAVQGGTAEEYLSGERSVTSGSLPMIAVPTTAGTGAELSRGAILTWPEHSFKGGIRGDTVFPKAAVVDPTLTLTLPPDEIRITGFDVFTHAVEPYISRRANPITAMLSRDAVKAICRFLPRVLQDPQDMLPRTYLSFYSMLMGYNLANSSTCLPHRLQYPLGAMTNTPHALGLAALYPAWIKATYQTSRQRFDNVADWMAAGMGIQKKGILKSLYHFMNRINLEPTLRDLGVDEQMCARLASMVSGKLYNDPWWQEGTDLSSIYLSALEPNWGLEAKS